MDPGLLYEKYTGPRASMYSCLPPCGHSSTSACSCNEEGYGDKCARDLKEVFELTVGMQVKLKDLEKADVFNQDLKRYNDKCGTITKVDR